MMSYLLSIYNSVHIEFEYERIESERDGTAMNWNSQRVVIQNLLN